MSATTDKGQAAPVPISKPTRVRFDFATVLGLFSGFALLIVALSLGGTPEAFLDVPSALIVLGGTIAITITSFGVVKVFRATVVTAKMFLRESADAGQAAEVSMVLAKLARKRGVLALQNNISQLTGDSLLRQGLQMVVDGLTVEEIERLLVNETSNRSARQMDGSGVLRRAAEVSPAMGLIGTLIGLVQMLGRLEDPSTIGPAMALALLTTFYGAILSNMVFAPLASKLEHNASEEDLVNRIYMMAGISIARQENPRRLEMLINSFLPPAKRVRHFD